MLILSSEKSKPSDVNLAGFSSFLGADVRLLDCRSSVLLLELEEGLTPNAALALSTQTLSELYREERSRESVRNKLLSFRIIFLHGVTAKQSELDEPLRWLSRGILIGAETVASEENAEFPVAGRRFTHQLSGAQYPRAKPVTPCDVLVAGMEGALPLITVCGKPTFLSLQLGSCNLLVSTVVEIPDPRQTVKDEKDIENYYDSLLPVLLFVRAACGDSCWQGGWRGARLIIDDPVLRRNYGMLDFARLFESMRLHSYSSTVAFIPWNQSRTSRAMASFFTKPGRQFSLCFHGCDHANNEYGSSDGVCLEQKSHLAMHRMQRHQQRTGLGCEPIMVFPQGRFSSACFRGLRSSEFLAAINSTRFPVDRDATPVSLCELLLPAFNRIYGFPVFLRHYVNPTFPLLFELFLGRPAFIVEHHDFFQTGFPLLEALAKRLNDAESKLVWGSLAETVERTCWKRAISPTHWEVRFFTDTFCITNNSQQHLSYRLLKEELDTESVTALVLNGRTVPIIRRDRCLEMETSLSPGETARFQLHRPKTSPPASVRGGGLYEGKVLMRRVLSEFRDEFLVKYPVILAPAKRIVKLLKATGDAGESEKSISQNAVSKL